MFLQVGWLATRVWYGLHLCSYHHVRHATIHLRGRRPSTSSPQGLQPPRFLSTHGQELLDYNLLEAADSAAKVGVCRGSKEFASDLQWTQVSSLHVGVSMAYTRCNNLDQYFPLLWFFHLNIFKCELIIHFLENSSLVRLGEVDCHWNVGLCRLGSSRSF